MQTLQCADCKKQFTPHTWNALVQVRQKVDHKRTLYHLEQLILKYGAHDKVALRSKNPSTPPFQKISEILFEDLDILQKFGWKK